MTGTSWLLPIKSAQRGCKAAASPTLLHTYLRLTAAHAGMAPMPMPMQGGAPVQMPQGVYMPQQAIYGPPVMMPGPGKAHA